MSDPGKIRPFLGREGGFSEAYPQVKELRVEVNQEGEFEWEHFKHQVFGKGNVPQTIQCGNPRCKQGGYSIDQIIYGMNEERKTEAEHRIHCQGHEGSPKGRRKGVPCLNFARIKIEIAYVSA